MQNARENVNPQFEVENNCYSREETKKPRIGDDEEIVEKDWFSSARPQDKIRIATTGEQLELAFQSLIASGGDSGEALSTNHAIKIAYEYGIIGVFLLGPWSKLIKKQKTSNTFLD